jgi:hypothetical protein
LFILMRWTRLQRRYCTCCLLAFYINCLV